MSHENRTPVGAIGLLACALSCAGPVVEEAESSWTAAESAALPAVQEATPPEVVEETKAPANYTEKIKGSKVEFQMIWIPEGKFWIGRTEVTWDEFLLYCDFERTDQPPPGADAVTKPSVPLDWAPYDHDWGAGQRPAVGMSWNSAKKYCRWLSINTGHDYRLPTEKEWELACGPLPEKPLEDWAWYSNNSGMMTQEVAQKKPNKYGLYDMLGNLWEYCRDPYDEEDEERAVLRGGSWKDKSFALKPTRRLAFDSDWTLADPNFPPGVWWIPDGNHLGLRVFRAGKKEETKEKETEKKD